MSKIKLYIAATLDGYIAREDGSLDWLFALHNPDNVDHGYAELLRGKNNVKELRRNFLIGMVESVSFAFKECIENAVYTINAQINTPN